jgi:hypothetical protein
LETYYQTEGFRQYMVLKGSGDSIDDFQLNMLMRYAGRGLLPLEIQGCDGRFQIAYDTKGALPLAQISEKQELDIRILQKLFMDLWNCWKEMEEYLLPPEGIRMAPELIYYFAGQQEFRFCFQLENPGDFRESFVRLVEFCMKHTGHQDSAAVMYIYNLYRLLQEEAVGTEEIRKFLEDMETQITVSDHMENDRTGGTYPGREPGKAAEVSGPAVAEPVAWTEKNGKPERREGRGEDRGEDRGERQEGERGGKREEKQEELREEKQIWIYRILTGISLVAVIVFALRYWVFLGYDRDCKFMIFSMIVFAFLLYSTLKLSRKRRKVNISVSEKTGKEDLKKQITEQVEVNPGETCVIEKNQGGETGLIQSAEQEIWKLKGVETQDILLNVLPGIIGRSDRAEYPLYETGISRRHARVFQNTGKLCIEDLASTNGTYYNGRRISVGEQVFLEEGSRLVLGATYYVVEKVKKYWENDV